MEEQFSPKLWSQEKKEDQVVVKTLSLLACIHLPWFAKGLDWSTVSPPKQLGAWSECLFGFPCWKWGGCWKWGVLLAPTAISAEVHHRGQPASRHWVFAGSCLACFLGFLPGCHLQTLAVQPCWGTPCLLSRKGYRALSGWPGCLCCAEDGRRVEILV